MTSIVVRHSWQFGVAFFVLRSQKVFAVSDHESRVFSKQSCVRCMPFEAWVFGETQIHIIQANLPKEVDMAYAPALKVERTTLPICLECHTMGENSVVSFKFGGTRHDEQPLLSCKLLRGSKAGISKAGKTHIGKRYGANSHRCFGM